MVLFSTRKGSGLELDKQLAARVFVSPFGTCDALLGKCDDSGIGAFGRDVSIDEVMRICFSSTYKSVWDLARHGVREHIFDGLQVIGMCKAHLGTRRLRTENICGGYVVFSGRLFIAGRFVVVGRCRCRRRGNDDVREALGHLWCNFLGYGVAVPLRWKFGCSVIERGYAGFGDIILRHMKKDWRQVVVMAGVKSLEVKVRERLWSTTVCIAVHFEDGGLLVFRHSEKNYDG